jgi:hypothetical protein
MPDIREVLDRAAPSISPYDPETIERRARRRQIAPRALVAVLAIALVGVGVALLVSERTDRTRVSSNPSTTLPITTSTATALPAYVDPSPSDPALMSTAPRCTAADFRFLRSEPLVSQSTRMLAIFLAVDRPDACSLLSYPSVDGLAADGTWESIPVLYSDQDAISSFVWEGVIDPAAPGSGGLAIVTRFDSIQPSWFVDGRCPGRPLTARHYTALRFVLRNGGGTIELPGVELHVSGCETILHRFGFESGDGRAVTPSS